MCDCASVSTTVTSQRSVLPWHHGILVIPSGFSISPIEAVGFADRLKSGACKSPLNDFINGSMPRMSSSTVFAAKPVVTFAVYSGYALALMLFTQVRP